MSGRMNCGVLICGHTGCYKSVKRQVRTVLLQRTYLDDPWYCLLNESKAQARNRDTAFIRDVRVGAEPLCVLGSQRQLNDLQRFCCNLQEFKPLTVDPTCNIGKFNITPISYQNMLLQNRQDSNHPTLIEI